MHYCVRLYDQFHAKTTNNHSPNSDGMHTRLEVTSRQGHLSVFKLAWLGLTDSISQRLQATSIEQSQSIGEYAFFPRDQGLLSGRQHVPKPVWDLKHYYLTLYS